MVSRSELQDLAHILRRDVLLMTSAAGSGHPTSCLSAAEIMSVLFFHEMRYDPKNAKNPENDEFILSKGHAAPILYAALKHAGCIKSDLLLLRKYGSPLEGHPVPSLDWVKVATGSLGQGLSVGLGMALAARYAKKAYRTYVLLGDSETAEGSIYEALQLAAHYQVANLCVIVDVNRLGQSNITMLGHDLKKYQEIFRAFQWNIIIVDGHNVKQLMHAFEQARKETKRPTVILAKTCKGKGVSFLENKEGWHGKALNQEQVQKALQEIPNPQLPKGEIRRPPESQKTAFIRELLPLSVTYAKGSFVATREAYGNVLAKIVQRNQNSIALDAEVKNSTDAQEAEKVRPEQFVECFIAEQNMVSMALGMAVKGLRPFVSTFAAFFTRAHDQLRMAAVSQAKIVCVGSHCGSSIGEDGPSQMGLEDIALFRSLPGSTVVYPADAVATEKLVAAAEKNKGITYIRTTRVKTPVIYDNKETFPVGGFKILTKVKKAQIVIAAAGITVQEALKACVKLKEKGIPVIVVDCYSIKPFDHARFSTLVSKYGNKVLIVEDHYKEGGLGEMIMSACAGKGIKFMHRSITEIPHSGSWPELAEKFGITEKGIIKAVRELLYGITRGMNNKRADTTNLSEYIGR